MTDTQQNILLVAPNRVGDLVMATPAFRAIRNHLDHARITLIARPFLIDLLRPSPFFDVLLAGSGHGDGFLSMVGTIARLRKRRFDLAVLFPNSFRSALVSRLGGCKRALGYDRDARDWLLTDHLKPVIDGGRFVPVPTIEYYLELARYLGATEDDRRMELSVDEADRERAAELLEQAGLARTGPLVLMSPGASFGPSKCWPAENFARTADVLSEKLNAEVALICAPSELEIALRVQQHSSTQPVILGQGGLTLGVLKAVIQSADLVISNDTGARHIAAALDRPALTLFGPTDPTWARIDYEKETIVRIDTDCGPCQLPNCPTDHRCMTGIAPERVVDEAVELLNRYPQGRTPNGCG